MKYLMETKGQFQLVDYATDNTIQADRPSVIEMTRFFESRVALDQIRVLGKLKDEASDEEFVKYLAESEGDMELAVDSFLSAFGVTDNVTEKVAKAEKDPEPAKTPAKGGKSK